MKMKFEITFEMEEREYKPNSYDTRPAYSVNEMRDFLKGALGNNPYAHNPTRRMTDLKVVHKRGKQ